VLLCRVDALELADHFILALVFSDGWRQTLALAAVRYLAEVNSQRLTLGQNLPLGSLGSPFLGHQVAQGIEQFLHLGAALALGQFVADAELWGPTIRLGSGVGSRLLAAKVANGLML
jgi:hypothetical protein